MQQIVLSLLVCRVRWQIKRYTVDCKFSAEES